MRHDQQLMPGESWQTSRTTMTMQTDGNLVVYDKDTWGVWSSVTSGHDGAYRYFGTDGAVSVVYHGTTLWPRRRRSRTRP
ncbi:hypothetical protein [Streptomyces sp. NPDC056660]|uniref:hypothetical protein n=1 Tax=Streptomyces sp. NPDC056660 TaxID=3345897 RepID=UPI0036B586D5